MNKTLRANLCILLTAMIWGSAFVAQRSGMDSIGPIYFNALRNFVGCASVLIVMLVFGRLKMLDKMEGSAASCDKEQKSAGIFLTDGRKALHKGGLACGSVLFFASNFQQMGLVTVDAGKSGFLTAMYIVLVPILGLLLHKPLHANHVVGALLGVTGLYFLCINGSFSIQTGDLLSLVGALGWAVHILVVDHFAPKLNPLKLSAAQFFVCAVLSTVLGTFVEDFTIVSVMNAGPAILYAGIMSSGVAFTLQIIGQRHASPAAASILMSMEALFAAISGFLFLGEVLTAREFIGCAFMMVAVLFAQFSFGEIKEMLKRK